jgi:hypothetical protein
VTPKVTVLILLPPLPTSDMGTYSLVPSPSGSLFLSPTARLSQPVPNIEVSAAMSCGQRLP